MQKSIFKQGERFHAGFDNHFDHCRVYARSGSVA